MKTMGRRAGSGARPRLFAFAMARDQIGGLVAVACAVFGGAAMVTACAVIGETGLTSHASPERLAAADILVAARQHHPVPEDLDPPLSERVTIPSELVEVVAAVPGVAAAVGDLTFPASILSLEAPTEGHGWASAALGGSVLDGTAPEGPGQIVLDAAIATDAGLAVGERTEIATAAGTAEYLVTGVVDAPGSGVYFEEATAAALAENPGGEVDLIAVAVEPGASLADVAADIEAAGLPEGLIVATGEARGDVEFFTAAATRGELVAMAGSLSGTVLILVGCVVAGALSVSVANQRRDLALLRALGATPRRVRRLVAAQAAAVAAIALVPGIAAGHLLAGAFADALTGVGLLSEALPLARTPLSALLAAALMLPTVRLAARGAAMRISRMPATEAVAESRVEPREPSRLRVRVGLVLFAVALAQSLLPLFTRSEAALVSTATGALMAIVGLALAAPALVRALTGHAARRLSDRTGAPQWLAVSNSRAYALRTAGSVTVLALAVALTLTQLYTQTTLERAAAADLEAGLRADATVTGAAVGGVAPAEIAELADEPGVTAAVPMTSTTVLREYEFAGDRWAESYAAPAFGPGAEQVVDVRVDAGDLADLAGESIAVSTATARVWGVDVGDEVRLVLANGVAVRPSVVATYERGIGFGSVIVSTDLLAAHSGARLFEAVLLSGDAAAATVWASDRPGLDVRAGPAMIAAGPGSSPERWINLLVSVALLGYVLLGVGNSLVASTSRRRGEFAALRLVGATPRQIRSMVRREAVLLSAMAIGAGLAISVPPMSLLGLGFTGRPWPQGPLWPMAAIAAAAAVIAYAATMMPTRRALGEPPAAVLGSGD